MSPFRRTNVSLLLVFPDTLSPRQLPNFPQAAKCLVRVLESSRLLPTSQLLPKLVLGPNDVSWKPLAVVFCLARQPEKNAAMPPRRHCALPSLSSCAVSSTSSSSLHFWNVLSLCGVPFLSELNLGFVYFSCWAHARVFRAGRSIRGWYGLSCPLLDLAHLCERNSKC